MKKLASLFLAFAMVFAAQAQTKAYKTPGFGSNWALGIDGGVATPLAHHYSFFGDVRGSMGFHLQKQLSPVFAVGIDALLDVNTASWYSQHPELVAPGFDFTGRSTTAIDHMYVGAYTSANLMNLFGGFACKYRPFEIELTAGAGWGHEDVYDSNYLMTKAGVNFNFNLSRYFTLSLKPSVSFNMTGSSFQALDVDQASAAYSRDKAVFHCMIGCTYHFGRIRCASLADNADIDALNAQVNALRGELDACLAATAASQAGVAALAAELEACKNRKPEVIEKVSDNLQSVRYIFYKVGSSKITADQQPNVEMVASYLKNHPESTVVIKGYASQDGNLQFNEKLAAARAESVKTSLIKKYGIAADRISAQGEGIGHMFSENDWNRVSICTLQ